MIQIQLYMYAYAETGLDPRTTQGNIENQLTPIK
jgi:hypothetical protein